MNSKILASLMVIALVGAVAGAGTFAYFTDTETSSGNTFTADKLNLEFSSTSGMTFGVGNVAPGNNGEGSTTLHSASGSMDGLLDVAIPTAAFSNPENGAIEPEYTDGSDDQTGGSTAGELGANLELAIFIDVNQNGWDSSDYQLEKDGSVVSHNTDSTLQYADADEYKGDSWNDIETMSAGDTDDLVVKWDVPASSTGNEIMTDKLEFDIETSLEQSGGTGVAA